MGKIIHIVLFKLKEQPSAQALDDVKAGIANLTTLKGPTRGHVGPPEIAARTQGYDYGFFSEFPSRAALDEYAVSQAHVDVVTKYIRPNIEAVLAYDWEMPE